MTKSGKRLLLVAMGLAILAAFGLKIGQSPSAAAPPASTQTAKLPKLVDIGAKSCIPCKKMAPILEELGKELAGKLDVEFIDISIKANLPRAQKYQIKAIPTQVFLDPDGKELWRHEGFISKEDILAKWKELGYDFTAVTQPAPAGQGSPK